jgi:DNA mismatch endonuclease (patch repair protein)
MDKLSPQQRHTNMAAIHGKDTKPEMVVRKWLWGHGFRYRLNHPRLPGKPDIVMRKYRTCIFVNGCFWHGHHTQFIMHNSQFIIESSECCKVPKTNHEFWVEKIRRNQERDLKVQHELAAMGWHSITIWECELKPKVREKTLESLAFTLNKIFLLNFSTQAQSDDLQDHSVRRYEIPEEEPMMAAEDVPTEHGNKAT